MLNDVKVIICGKEYKLKTAESPNYVFAYYFSDQIPASDHCNLP